MVTKLVFKKTETGTKVFTQVYSADTKESDFVYNGELIFDKPQWDAFYACLRRGSEYSLKDHLIVIPHKLIEKGLYNV
jgi:hypothetical protein